MARYSSGVKTTAGSTTLTLASIFSGASTAPKLREVGIFNTTSTAVDLKLIRLTAQGTPGAGQTEAKHDPDSATAGSTVFTTHSVSATTGDDLGYRASLGAAVGAGVIWTFGESGIRIPTGTANGVGILVENGTGQACQVYFVWDE